MNLLDVFAGLCLVGIIAVALAMPFAKQYRMEQATVRRRWDGTDQAHPVTFHDQIERLHLRLVAFVEAFAGPPPEARVYSRVESAYLNVWAARYAVRELAIMGVERVESADPLWIGLAIAAGLIGAAVGIFAETVWWSVEGKTRQDRRPVVYFS